MLGLIAKIPFSVFRGYTVTKIAKKVTITQARRYLTDLILVNDNKKSNLTEISEMSAEYLSSIHQSLEQSMRGAQQSMRSSVESQVVHYSPRISSLKQDPIR